MLKLSTFIIGFPVVEFFTCIPPKHFRLLNALPFPLVSLPIPSPPFPVLITRFFHKVTYIRRYLPPRAFGVPPDGFELLRYFLFRHFPLHAEIIVNAVRFSFVERCQVSCQSNLTVPPEADCQRLNTLKQNDRNPCIRISDPVLVAQKFHFNPAQ